MDLEYSPKDDAPLTVAEERTRPMIATIANAHAFEPISAQCLQ